MSENKHIYEDLDLNESSSARLGGSQQLEILPSPNSKRAPNFSAQILDRRGNFKGAEILEAQKFYRRRNSTRRRDFNVRHSSIAYYQAHEFCMSA